MFAALEFLQASGQTSRSATGAQANSATDDDLLLLGTIQSTFEAAMYTFVFMWTPALTPPGGEAIPHGSIFACFMLACMLGMVARIIIGNVWRVRVHVFWWSLGPPRLSGLTRFGSARLEQIVPAKKKQ